jgi:hypothetical protein
MCRWSNRDHALAGRSRSAGSTRAAGTPSRRRRCAGTIGAALGRGRSRTARGAAQGPTLDPVAARGSPALTRNELADCDGREDHASASATAPDQLHSAQGRALIRTCSSTPHRTPSSSEAPPPPAPDHPPRPVRQPLADGPTAKPPRPGPAPLMLSLLPGPGGGRRGGEVQPSRSDNPMMMPSGPRRKQSR